MIVQLQKFKGLFLSFILAATLGATAFFVAAQENPNTFSRYPVSAPAPKPVSSPTPKPVSNPTPARVPKVVTVPNVVKEKEKPKTKNRIPNESDTPAEKSIAVDPKVNVSFCVSEGNVKVNGWDRSEVRVYVNGGSQVGFKILQKSRQTGVPVWIMALGYDPAKNTDPNADECLSGDEIELDVPRNATVRFKSRESGVTIESVGKAIVENISGDVCLTNITQGIEATTYEGSITVGKSGGAMTLTSNLGNILAYEASPSEIGDVFKAKTINGMIALQQIEHRQMDVSSNSGSIKFGGELLTGGQYNFGTSSGSILLALPLNSSCMIYAILGFGTFYSEIPLIQEDFSNQNGSKSMTGVLGKGEAKLNLKTYNGKIHIKRQ